MELAQLVERFGLPIGLSVALVAMLVSLVWYLLRKVDRMGSTLDKQSGEFRTILCDVVQQNSIHLAQATEALSQGKEAALETHRLMRAVLKCKAPCSEEVRGGI